MDCDPDKIIKAFSYWLQVRESEGFNFPSSYVQLEADIMHSSLLRRIIRGDKIFEEPPPRAFSYPCYELLESGQGKPFEVIFDDTFLKFPCLIIDQSFWKIIESISDDEYICVYSMGHGERERWSKTKWKVKRMSNAIKHPRNWEIIKA